MSNRIKSNDSRKSTLADWSSALFAIFWGTWWADIYNTVFCSSPTFQITANFFIPPMIAMTIIIFYIAIFTYCYTKFLWNLKTLSYKTSIENLRPLYGEILICIIGLSILFYYLYSIKLIQFHQGYYGFLLTTIWIICVSFTVIKSDKWPLLKTQ